MHYLVSARMTDRPNHGTGNLKSMNGKQVDSAEPVDQESSGRPVTQRISSQPELVHVLKGEVPAIAIEGFLYSRLKLVGKVVTLSLTAVIVSLCGISVLVFCPDHPLDYTKGIILFLFVFGIAMQLFLGGFLVRHWTLRKYRIVKEEKGCFILHRKNTARAFPDT